MELKVEENEDVLMIKNRIKQLGIKHKKIAMEIGITDVYLSYILHEKRPMTDEVKNKLRDFLGLE